MAVETAIAAGPGDITRTKRPNKNNQYGEGLAIKTNTYEYVLDKFHVVLFFRHTVIAIANLEPNGIREI